MILLNGDLRFGFGLFTENKAIRSYFKGTYYRCVASSVIDKTNGQNTIGVLYICAQTVLLLLKTHGTHGQMYELEAKDVFQAVGQDNDLLKQVADNQSSMMSFTGVKTSRPVTFVELNGRYIFMIDFIQPMNSNFGATTVASETWLVGKDYIEKNANLLAAINAVLHAQPFDFTLPLPGSNMQRSALTRYWLLIVLALFMVAVFAGLVYIGIRPGPA